MRFMQLFREYFKTKLANQKFQELFKRECHVCQKTMEIFARLDKDKVTIESLAAEMNIDPEKLRLLRDADYCDPYLVETLCVHFHLPLPNSCPRK
jgi:hypothetical protein